MNQLSGYLYARPSIAEGISRLLDIGGTLQAYNSSLSHEQADYLALLSDWTVVGDDIEQAIEQYGDSHPQMRSQALIEAYSNFIELE